MTRTRLGLTLALAFLSSPATRSRAADSRPPVTDKSPIRVWPDPIGYRPRDPMIVIVAADKHLPADLSARLSVRDAASGKQWSAKDFRFTPFNNGKTDGESGDFTAHLDLSTLKDPG